MALPTNDKIIGDLGHTADHNAIVDEIIFIKENYLSASGGSLDDFLRKDTASALYATIVSPEFSGIPLAPTAASGTNTSQIATTQFVRSEVSSLVDSAPSTLDTLNELAAALGDDPNFATTVTQSLSNKLDSAVASATYLTQSSASNLYFPKSASGGLLTEAEASGLYLPISASSSLSPVGYLTASAAANTYAPLNSPSLIGVPTAPTASAGSNSNQIATTEFVSFAVLSAQSGSVDLSAYLTTAAASATYLPISASSTFSPVGYLTASAAADIYLTQENAALTYLPISASANFGGSASVDLSEYLTSAVASATYLPISASAGITTTAAAIMSPTEPENPINGAIWVDTDSEMLPYSSSAVDLSIYLTKESASATYIAKDDVIDCGGP